MRLAVEKQAQLLDTKLSLSLVRSAAKEGIKTVVVGGFITDETGRLLILKRSPGEFLGGKNEIPSGKVDPGETLFESLEREIAEETGLTMSAAFGPVNWFDYEGINYKPTRQYNFYVQLKDIRPVVLSKEHDSFIWLDRENLSSSDLDFTMQRIVSEFFHRWMRGRKSNREF